MKKLRTGDEVFVISGKDKGKTGTLTKMISDEKCFVSGIKIVKRHTKPNPQAGIEGGIVEKESPINISNIAIYNPSTKKPDRVGIRVQEDGSKIRVFKSSGKEIK
tara:strand:- start:164 stop:478 length:315 start_codon:yes stop_codon:yes gene_type:complete